MDETVGKRTVTAAATMVCVAGVLTGTAGSSAAATETREPVASARAGTPIIAWQACKSQSLAKYHAECGMLSVPLDYRNPGGTKIQLAVSRVRHTVPNAQYQGVVLLNPGGPGGSGLGMSVIGPIISQSFHRPDVGGAYDWIGFDPRGVGASIPALSCNPNYMGPNRPDYIPRTVKLTRTWLARSAGYAKACGRRGGALLRHMTTADSARDMDRIREALGQKQITYYGFSYGTYLGQVYTRLFPTHMRRMVLDSTIDPRRVFYRANLDQDVAFETTMNAWFAWLARYDSYYHLGKTRAAVRRTWYRVKDQLRRKPISGTVGPDEWTDIFLWAGYYQVTWTDLGEVFAGWVNRKAAKPVVDAYKNVDTPGDDNGYAVYLAVQCTDAPWPTRWATWRRDNWRVYQVAPYETWANAWFNAPCIYWPAPAHNRIRITGKDVGSALLVDETLDAATPYEGSVYVRSVLRHSRLIAEPGGTTHAGTLSGNTCVDGKVFDYLANGTLPARRKGNGADVVCSPLPQPVPDDVAARFATAAASPRDAQTALGADLVDAVLGRARG